jgi:hypothetical protein
VKTKTAPDKPTLGPDVWPTRATDQNIAIEILRRHSQQFGYVKFIERIEEVSAEDGGTFEVEYPAWVTELSDNFKEAYGPDKGEDIFLRIVRWLMREIFGGHSAVSLN